MKIISVTISNILTDSRIIKSITSLSKSFKVREIYGYGIEDFNENHYHDETLKLSLNNILLWTQKLRVSKKIKRPFLFVEVNIKFFMLFVKNRPDLIYVNDYHLLLSAVVYKFFKKNKIIYDAHELESKTIGISNIMSKSIYLIERISWKHIDYLITVSIHIAEWYELNLGHKNNKIITNSPVFINDNRYSKYKNLREKFGIQQESIIFIYVGILNSGRGLDIIIEVFKNHDIESHLIVMGYGPFEDKIKSVSKLYKNIHFHEPVPYIYVTEIARSADYGLVLIENTSLSDYLSAPNKLFEYACSGIPVIASNFPEMSRIIENHSLGDVIEPNSIALYKQIKALELMDKYRISPKTILELSWQSQEVELLKVLDELNL